MSEVTDQSSQYSQRLDALFQLEFFGMKLGLENIAQLLERLGNPERTFRSIHIAGTNGKGSVAAMLAAIHQADGKRTGLYTSPHLIDFRERIRINGKCISKEFIADFLARIWPTVEELRATFFEVTTAMAFEYFASQKVDIAIIETGLGGRLDATNVLERPLATVITSIGMDHTAQLGNTLEAIANEKAGIFKRDVPAIVNCDPALDSVFKKISEERNSPLRFVREWDIPKEWKSLQPSLEGEHQEENLKTVLATISGLECQPSFEAIQAGLKHTALLTGLRGRMEEIHDDSLSERSIRLFLDVGHNEPAFRRISEYFLKRDIRPVVIIGLMKDKDIPAILDILSGFASRLVAVQAETARALPSAELTEMAQFIGLECLDGGSVATGINHAIKTANSGEVVLVTGSHYVAGEFLKNFHGAEVVTGMPAQA
ncbi:MAG TPA: folylpolyglutamate synthase/dihydrofolate synthase family protein [Candidatus Kapabacteria bacterium]|jgi:dihydrofolate synthase/folylpolyglutamate synthase|nr:folylpolyglutamate synthase/dihydrofolate synthase family protein [Candidatus Kapabacteria bacterium]